MYKQIGKRITVISILFIMFFSFLINKGVLGVTDDDGPDVTDTSIDWQFTCFKDGTLGTGFTSSSFTTNDKYGWCEYEKDGVKYAVMAGATHELNKSAPNQFPRLSYIHYFNYYDTFQFKFADESFDNNTYNGIILDSCGASMNPTQYRHALNVQILDVYFSSSSYSEKISGKSVVLSMDGTFSKKAGKSNKQNLGEVLHKTLYEAIVGVGDVIQKRTNEAVGFSKNKSEKLTYTRADIEANEKMNKQIQVTDAPQGTSEQEQEKIDEEKYKTLVTKNLQATAYNDKGEEQTIYTIDMDIPVIPTDYYSSTTRQVDSIDADFFDNTGKNDNTNWNNTWRRLFRNASRVSIYIAAGFLFIMIIWRSVVLVLSTMGSRPKGAFEAKKAMNKFFGAVLTLAGIYLIMVIIMFLYKQILNVFLNGNNSRYLIRVNVEGVYSFNTNIIGYTKYLTLGTDESIRNAVAYCLTTLINYACIGAMILRMIFIGILMVLAPFTAVNYMSDTKKTKTKGFLRFDQFIKRYIIAVFLPLVLAGIYKFILLVA